MIKKLVVAISLALSGSIAVAQTITVDQAYLEQRQNALQDTANVLGVLISELALQKGDPKSALSGYVLMLERTKNPEVAARGMELAIASKDFVTAQNFLDQWKLIEPKESDEREILTWQLNLSQGNTKEAFAKLPEIFKKADDDKVRALFLFMAQFVQQGDESVENAFSVMQKQAKKYPRMPEAALSLTLYAAAANNEPAVFESLSNLAKLNPELSQESQIVLGILVQNRPQFVVNFFEKVPSENLGTSWQKIKVAVLMQDKKDELAYDALNNLIKRTPNDASLYIEAGYLARKLNKSDQEILGFYQKAYELSDKGDKSASQAAILAGIVAHDMGNKTDAKVWFNRVTDKTFEFDRDLLLARTALEDNDYKTAQKYLDQAKTAKSHNLLFTTVDLDELQYNLYFIQKNYQAALKQINQMVKENAKTENLPSMLYSRALLYSDKLQNHAAAAKDLEAFMKLKPNDPDGLNSLGYTLLSVKGREAEGLEYILAAHKLKPDAPEINDSLGWAYFKQGQPQEALPYLEAAFAAMPIAEVSAHLGEVLWSLGKEQEARVVWEKGLSDDSDHAILLETMKRYKVK